MRNSVVDGIRAGAGTMLNTPPALFTAFSSEIFNPSRMNSNPSVKFVLPDPFGPTIYVSGSEIFTSELRMLRKFLIATRSIANRSDMLPVSHRIVVMSDVSSNLLAHSPYHYSSVTHPKLAFFTNRIYFASVPLVDL